MFIILTLNFNANGPEPPPLTALEKKWKIQTAKKHNVEVIYLGRDTEYRQDSVLYLNIDYSKNQSFYKRVINNIEGLTIDLSHSYLKSVAKDTSLRLILISYSDYKEGKYDPQIPGTNRPNNFRCIYNVTRNVVIPQIQRLEIPYFHYRYIDEQQNDLTLSQLGGSLSKSSYFNELTMEKDFKRINSNNFNGIPDCVEYRTGIPQVIKLKNGTIKCYYNYVFHRDQAISAKITYECYPQNKSFNYAEVVNKLTCKPRKQSDSYIEEYSVKINRAYLNEKYLNYEKQLFNVLVKTTADTTSIPWIIEYETSLNHFIYFKDIDYIYDDL